MSEHEDIQEIAQQVAVLLREEGQQEEPTVLNRSERELEERVAAIEAGEGDPLIPRLLGSSRFRIDDTDLDPDFHETKIPEGTTVRGTKIAVDWEKTGSDGTKKTRSAFVPVDEIQDEIEDQTGTTMQETFAYRSHLFGSQTVQLSAADWRNRIVEYRFAWDNEPTAVQWPHIRKGHTYWTSTATGHLTLFTVNMGGDSCEIWVDGDSDGVLMVTTVDNGNFGDIIVWITSSGIGVDPS